MIITLATMAFWCSVVGLVFVIDWVLGKIYVNGAERAFRDIGRQMKEQGWP